MKRVAAVFAFTMFSVVLVSSITPEVFAYDWRDDFGYQTLDALRSSGWTISNGQLVSVGGDVVNLTATKEKSCVISYIFPGYDFPSGISEFSVEIRHRLLGMPGGRGCSFSILTERHKYSFVCSEELSIAYGFLVDDQLKVPLVRDVIADWHSLTLEKEGNVLNWYLDGELKGSYAESANTRDGLVGVELHSSSSYDYVSILVPSPPTVQLLGFLAVSVFLGSILTATFLFALPSLRHRKDNKTHRHTLPKLQPWRVL